MKSIFKLIGVGVGISIFMLIRFYEAELFYDPLLSFFKTEHTVSPLPQMEELRLMANIGIRFLLNTLVSLGILWVLFRSREVLKFSSLIYAVFGILSMMVCYGLLLVSAPGDHLLLFYVRRFLIQPLLVFLLIPAFYVQRLRQA